VTTIGDLREYLDAYPDDYEVRLLEQPSWPFEYSIEGIWHPTQECTECGSPADSPKHDASNEAAYDHEYDGPDPEDRNVVYLTEGSQLKYGSRRGWEEQDRFR